MKLRRLEESDKEMIAEWVRVDTDHKDYAPDWIYSGDKKEKFILEDSNGPILGFRIGKSLRVDIQFDETERIRTAKGLIEGFAWLLHAADKAGFTEVIFQSKSKPLINFCKKRFQFVESPGEIVRLL